MNGQVNLGRAGNSDQVELEMAARVLCEQPWLGFRFLLARTLSTVCIPRLIL